MRPFTGIKIYILLLACFLSGISVKAQVTTATFNCTGAPQNYTIPPCVTSVTVEAWGAGGGGGGIDTYTGSPGGGGAYAYATLAVTPGQVLTVYVGCGGLQGGACQTNGPGGAGGYGYGSGGNGGNSGPSGCSGPGGGGGGGSAVLNGGTVLVVAGGGGGGGGGGNHGDGGAGGGGGQSPGGFAASTSAPGGILGASGSANGSPGSALTLPGEDGAGGGGGGGGVQGGTGGAVAPGTTDVGGGGGGGGTSVGTMTIAANGQTPGNAGSPYLCAGCAVGGAGGAGAPGVPGDVVISYTTPPALTSNIASTNSCVAATATITPTSGTAGYTYTWSPSGGNAATASGLTNGTYTVTFTDAHGCTGTKTTTITLPTAVTGTINTSPGLCGVASGTITASGGTPGYTYTWSPTGGNAATTTTLVNGSYTVAIKDAMGCTGMATTSVSLPPALTLTAAHSNIACNGLSNATATATASGGSGTYTVAINTTPVQFALGSTLHASGLAAGSYTVGVQDSNGCQDTVSFTVTQPAVLQQTITPTTPICIGASSVLSDAISGGTAPYNVTWSSGGGGTGAVVTATVTPATTTVYSATVTDANTCTNTSTATVVVNALPTVTVNSATICVGNSTNLNAAGANTYSWNTGTGLSATTGASVTANPVATTVYTITGTDANNCMNTATSTVNVNPTPTVTATSGTICIGGTTTLTASGAASYAWSPATGLSATTGSNVTANPATTTVYTITGTDVNTCTSTATATVTVNSLPAVTVNSGTICVGQQTATLTANGASTYSWANSTGLSSTTGTSVNATPVTTTVYTVTGTDANSCVNTATSTVTVNPLPVITLSGASICAGGSATLTAGGATTYSWAPGTGLSSTTGSTVTANPASTTQYTVIGMDGNGCVYGDTASVIVITNPTVNVPSATICVNSPTTLTATGCNTYTWSPATGLSSTNGSTVTANPASTTVYTIDGSVGTCTATTTATVTVNSLPVLTIGSNSPICENQALNLTSTGGPGYSWNGPNGFSSTNQNPTITPVSTAATGTYTLTVTDANTCVSTATVNVVINALPAITANSATICIGGSANLNANGASTYTWSPATGLSTTTGPSVVATPTATTVYTIDGTDGNNCSNTGTSTVTVNNLPVVVVPSATMCVNHPTTLTATGANTYTWSPATGLSSTTGSVVIANPASTTSYTITGDNGCTGVTTTTVTVNPAPIVTASSATICPNTVATLNAGGTASTYTWSNGSTSPTVTLTPGSTTVYTVTGTDVNTCTNTATGTVTVNPALVLNVSTNAPVCVGSTLSFTSTSNPQSVIWQWRGPNGFSSTVQNPSIPNAQLNMSGTYSLSSVDVNGCFDSTTINVVINPPPTPSASNNTPICENQNQAISFTGFNITGGTYVWTGPNGYIVTAQNPSIANPISSASGIYTLTVTDANNCVGSDTTLVIVSSNPPLTINSPTTCITTPIGIWVNGSSTYTWSPATDLDTTMGGNVVFTPLAAGAYTFNVTGTNLNGCQTTTVTVVNVYPISSVTVHSATICAGHSIPLVASGASTYTWSPSTGLSSSTGSLVIASPSSTTIYTVTGKNSYGCDQIVPDTVVVNPVPALVLTPLTATGCEPLCVAFSNTAGSPGNYYWNFGDGKNDNSPAPTHCFSAGNYTTSVQVTDSNGCSSTSTSTIVAYPKPIADFLASPQPTTIFDPIIHFQDGTSGGATIATWNWMFGDGKGTSPEQEPIYTYKDTGTYAVMLTVVSDRGCRDSIIHDVRIDDEYLVYVPNAFTPNHDGINDVFLPKGEGIVEYKIHIYDRWGQLAFYSTDLTVGWDGRHLNKGNEVAPEDIYIWKIETKNQKGEPKILKGHVSLLK